MRDIIIILNNFYKQTFDTKRKYIFFLGLPIISFILMFVVFGQEPGFSKIEIGIVKEDDSALSNYIFKEIESSHGYTVSSINVDELESSLVSDKFDGVIHFPKNLLGNILNDKNYKISIFSIKNEGVTIGLKYRLNDLISNYISIESSVESEGEFNIILDELQNSQIKLEKVGIASDSNLSYIGSRALGFLLMFLFAQGMTITALILKNRENKTYSRLRTSPISELSYLLGNLFAAFIILLLQVVVSLIAASILFKINFIHLIPLLIFYNIMVISLGLFVTSISKSKQMANNLSILIMTPLCMLGGCFWEVSLMPGFMQRISLFIPQFWAMDAIEKVSLEGGSISINIFILLGFSLLFISLFLLRTKKEAS